MILVKNFKILPNLFLFLKNLNIKFDSVLDKKRSLSRLKKCLIKIREKIYIFLGGKPMIKNLNFFRI